MERYNTEGQEQAVQKLSNKVAGGGNDVRVMLHAIKVSSTAVPCVFVGKTDRDRDRDRETERERERDRETERQREREEEDRLRMMALWLFANP